MAQGVDFDSLRDLHNSANDLLHSPIIQKALLHQGHEKWVHLVSESSLKMLDVCGISRDVLLLVKDHVQNLQSPLRRVNPGDAESNTGTKIAVYNRYRKKLEKETLKCLQLPKGTKRKLGPADVLPEDHDLIVVVEVMREVRVTTVSIVESLLSLFCIPWLERRSQKGSFRLKMIGSGWRGFYDVSDELAVQSASKRLEAVEIAIEDLEVELDCMFRRLIQKSFAS